MKCYKTFSLNIVSWIIHYETSVRFTISVNALLRSHWAPLVLSDFVKPLGVLGSVASVSYWKMYSPLSKTIIRQILFLSEEQYVELLQKLMLTLILNSMFIFFHAVMNFQLTQEFFLHHLFVFLYMLIWGFVLQTMKTVILPRSMFSSCPHIISL